MSNTLFFYIFRDWRLVLILYYLLVNILVFLSFIYFVESTPIELIERYSSADALAAFLRIADRNGVTDHGLSL